MRIFIFRQTSPLMFPGLMAVKFNLFALPVLEGDGEQGLLQSRCPKPREPPATGERGQGFSHHIPTRITWEQGFVAVRGGRWAVLSMSTAPNVPVCPWGVQASPASPGKPAGDFWDTQHPWTSLGHPAPSGYPASIHPILLSPRIFPAYLQTPCQAASLLPQLAFITIILHSLPAQPALYPRLKSCANSLCIPFPTLAGRTVCREHSGLGERCRRCQSRAPATWLLPSWMICSINQGPEYFAFQMLPGKSWAGIWALGNIQEENGFVLSLALAHRRSQGGNSWSSSGFSPHGPGEARSYLRSFWGAQWEGLVAVGTGPSAAAL